MNLKNYIKNNLLIFDGGMGTLLQSKGLKVGELPERFNLSNPTAVQQIHKSYFDAGCNVVTTNTFGANSLKFSLEELEEIIKSAVENARIAQKNSQTNQPKWVALDLGPTGKMLKPYGDLEFEDAVDVFRNTVRLGVKYGVDLVIIETMNDCYETKSALLAVKEECSLPVIVSNAFSEDGKLVTGASPKIMVNILEGLGADAIGVNCSFGPDKLMNVVDEYIKYSSLPIIFQPNAGMPKVVNGKTEYDVSPKDFAVSALQAVQKGVKIVGGCCGTTPDHLKAVCEILKGVKPLKTTKKNYSTVTSFVKAVDFEKTPVLIGERINPTGKKKFKEALKNQDIDYVLKEGISQQEKGVHILDVNVGLPEIDEGAMLEKVVLSLQEVCDLPLQIDTSNPVAMERALRLYNGKAMINSVSGKEESMQAVFPLVKKYGGVVVCLTLDENGIPPTATERVEIAKKIIGVAKSYGIDKKNLIFDPLALTISADKNSAKETLKAVKIISEKLKCKTSLGVSNVSFGLPSREIINSNFFTMALNCGLSAGIMNPYAEDMLKSYYSYLALSGLDESFDGYINFANSLPKKEVVEVKIEGGSKDKSLEKSELQTAIIKGLKNQAYKITKELLKNQKPLDIINGEIIPALDYVGVGFENKTVYLPSLLMSAEASKVAFDAVKEEVSSSNQNKGVFVLATVKGDIHDIGKNIVKLLLENYGYKVIDLGRDVEPKFIVDAVVKYQAPMVGLSALMTTTVPYMQQTVKLIKELAPWCKTIVGGAVLTEDYAKSIGADKYCKDAMEAVRYAEIVTNK
ncbi:MAG: homocysteine S-methyltransferase family protein [Clostridia bacterium]|nr:homocysteine S-methyltransferase family protein [Clostridia bacterium]